MGIAGIIPTFWRHVWAVNGATAALVMVFAVETSAIAVQGVSLITETVVSTL